MLIEAGFIGEKAGFAPPGIGTRMRSVVERVNHQREKAPFGPLGVGISCGHVIKPVSCAVWQAMGFFYRIA
jgi:hypothetical protein